MSRPAGEKNELPRRGATSHGERPPARLSLTRRGGVLAVAAVALVAAGSAAGLMALTATGTTLLLACVAGLGEVLLARRAGSKATRVEAPARSRFSPWGEPKRAAGSWVRLDQHGSVVARLDALPSERGLYQRHSMHLSWHDTAGFWQATSTVPADREAYVPPAANEALARAVISQLPRRVFEAAASEPAASVRAYEKGDPLRQIAWRQTAHHGQLMSFDTEATRMPPVLVAVDTLACPDAGAVAATAAALLRALRESPDVLLTDGVGTYRTHAQQERFLAALMADSEAHGSLDARAHLVSRLAAQRRRSVILVTGAPESGLAAALGCPARVVSATGTAVAAALREGAASEGADGADERPRPRADRAGSGNASAGAEVAAALVCGACGLLCIPALHGFLHEGAWPLPVAALLGVAATAGSAVGAWARSRRRAGRSGRGVRVAALALLTVVLLAAGLVAAGALFEARWGFSLLGATSELLQAARTSVTGTAPEAARAANPLGALVTLVSLGADQLAGTIAIGTTGVAWDLVVILAAAAGAPLVAALASSRVARPGVALLPVGLWAASQVIMNTPPDAAPLAAAGACGIVLLWLSHARRVRVARLALVAALALGTAAGGVGLAATAAPGRTGGLAARRDATSSGTSINTLVDLSRDLRRASNEAALSYTTNAGEPLYLALSVLEDFDGDTWEFDASARDAVEETTPLREMLVRAADSSSDSGGIVYTRLTAMAEGVELPVPPGTARASEEDAGTLFAMGSYLAPVTATSDLDRLASVAETISTVTASLPDSARERIAETANAAQELAALGLPEDVDTELPTLLATLEQARAEGAAATAHDTDSQLAAIRWIVSYFEQGAFSYSLSAPDGSGTNNLAVVNDLLEERRGYCVHYASAVAVLARGLGLPSRIVLGFSPTDELDGSYVVRMSQLHAWAEVWLDDVGWVGIDMTPAAGVDPNEPGAQTATPRETAPSTSGPNSPEEPPVTTTEPAPDDGAAAPDDAAPEADPDATSSGAPAWVSAALLATGAVLAAAGVAAAVAAALRRHRYDALAAWLDLFRAARKAGVRWEPSATEDQVCELICALLPPERRGEVRALCRNACLTCYGGAPDACEPRVLLASVRELRRALRGRRRTGTGTSTSADPDAS